MNTRLHDVQTFAAEKLNEIAVCFKPGAKLTLLVRTPGNDNADFCLSNDDLAEAIKALHRRNGNNDNQTRRDKPEMLGEKLLACARLSDIEYEKQLNTTNPPKAGSEG